MEHSLSYSPMLRSRQRGITLFGLLFWAIVVAVGAVVAIKVLPTINEFSTLRRVVNKIAHDGLSTVPEIRTEFERLRSVEYGIVHVTGNDLQITKENDKVVIGFAYDAEIELFGPVYLVIKYEGRSKAD